MTLRIKRQTTALPQLKGGELAQHNTTVYVGAIDEQSNIPLNPFKSINGQTSGDIVIPTSPGAATGSFGFTSIHENVDETGTTHYNLANAGKFRIGTRLNTVSPYMFALNVADTNPTLSNLLYSPIEILFDYLAFESPVAGTALSKIKLPDGFGDNEAHDNGELDLSALVGTIGHMGYLRFMVVEVDAEQTPGDGETAYFRISDTLAVLVHEYRNGWYIVPSSVLTMTTTSTSSSWSPTSVVNSGATLHWEVTGAATYSVDADSPVFDFSTPGEKVITITSEDDLVGVEYIDLASSDITSFDATGLTGLQSLDLSSNQLTSFDATVLTGLQELYLENNQLTSFDATGLTGLQLLYLENNQLTSFDATGLTGLQELVLNINQLTSFDATGLTGLQTLNLYNNQLTSFDATGLTGLQTLSITNNQLTSFDATGLTGLQTLYLDSNQLTTTAINSMLDQLIAIGNTSGLYFDARTQTGGGGGDPAKIAALDAIWGTVLVDPA